MTSSLLAHLHRLILPALLLLCTVVSCTTHPNSPDSQPPIDATAGGVSGGTSGGGMNSGGGVPADFSLVFHVRNQSPSDDPLTQNSQTILEPNLKLRAAVGSGAQANYYPPLTRILKPEEYEQVWAIVRDNHLLAEPTSPRAQASISSPNQEPVLLSITIRANGRSHQYQTTPQESPPTVQLLTRLVDFRLHAPGTRSTD